MKKEYTAAAQRMLKILEERSRVIEHYGAPPERVPLLLDERDMRAASIYAHAGVERLRNNFVAPVQVFMGRMGVWFHAQDTLDYLYTRRMKDWEYSRERKEVSTLVLNFASGHTPGGGVRTGGHGQEESICENSTLLASLESDSAEGFYRMLGVSPEEADAVMISPYVEVFGVDGMQRQKSDIVAVMSVVPPKRCNDSAVLERYIRGMLRVAAREGYKHIVLGAWGCGSAGNDPELVAAAFESVLRERIQGFTPNGQPRVFDWSDFFRSVTMAVPEGGACEAFRKRFSDFWRAEREAERQRIRDGIAADRAKYLSAVRGSLLGGAIGDALGYPVEFLQWPQIVERYGKGGIRRYERDARSGLAQISDDTQMTLFTATGMLVGDTRGKLRGIAGDPEGYVYMAYRDWYVCQCGKQTPAGDESWLSYGHEHITSWLYALPEMRAWRAPGNTCLSAIRSGDYGTMDMPINDSKGCGGVMRIAPVALYYRGAQKREQLEQVCYTAANVAALTHGHPLGYIPAAALACIVSRAAFGGCPYEGGLSGILRESMELMSDMFDDEPQLTVLLHLLERAQQLAGGGESDVRNIERLGGGWVAEEALAIAVYCCLRHPDDFSAAVVAAVNHSGDSDSTGAIAGNIMGALLGYDAIDPMWLDGLELRDVIDEVATDLCDHCRMTEGGEYCDEDWMRKYVNYGRYGQDMRDVEK